MSPETIDDLCELNATCVRLAPDFQIGWVDGDGWIATWTWDGFANRMSSGPRHANADGYAHALAGLIEHAARKIRSSGRRYAA